MSWQISEDGSHFIVEGMILCHDHDNPVLEIAPPGGIANLGVYAGAPWAPTETWHAVRQPGDIIDRIDELVDEQMAGGEPRQGYDFGDPTYPRCPHCARHWHGLPVTERIAEMYAVGRFDESYRVDEDGSQVLCEGSEFIGPARPRAEMGASTMIDAMIDQVNRGVLPGSPAWLHELVDATVAWAWDVSARRSGPGWRELAALEPWGNQRASWTVFVEGNQDDTT